VAVPQSFLEHRTSFVRDAEKTLQAYLTEGPPATTWVIYDHIMK